MEPLKTNSVASGTPPPSALDLTVTTHEPRAQFRRLAILSVALALAFSRPLLALVQFALRSDLYSYVLLVPFISGYLGWLRKRDLVSRSAAPRKLALFPVVAGLLFLAGGWLGPQAGLKLAPVDSLALTTFSFVCLFVGASFFCLDKRNLQTLAFPLAFLVFLVPFPGFFERAVESLLQHRSADAAELLFGIVGTPLVRKDVVFQLPGFNLQVAPECSGIRSSLVLFITSLVAGQLFLRSFWARALFALIVIPLGIFRNALRIVIIGELCVHVDPGFIYSPLHRRGGPVFFVVSLVPFLLLLYWLRKRDTRKGSSPEGLRANEGGR